MEIEEIIASENLSKRTLSSLKKIVENSQPNNAELINLLDQYINNNISKENLDMINLTIAALLDALDYPTDEWAITENQFKGLNYLKEAIIEYIITPVKNMDVVLDNVGFKNNSDITTINNSIVDYMVNYGAQEKIQGFLRIYSTNYQSAINHSTNPGVIIPIYAKAITSKIKEMNKNNKNNNHTL